LLYWQLPFLKFGKGAIQLHQVVLQWSNGSHGISPFLAEGESILKIRRLADFHVRHNLSNDEKAAYIDAELCLMFLPAKMGFPGAQTRWDDLQFAHINSTNVVHDVVCISLIP
jgi:hypothetical protein